jgi:D-alanyl-D-alanine carboxypeptidase/D-alanyl-D-alanine-endopeptidase (penicillin-binding protein 4)
VGGGDPTIGGRFADGDPTAYFRRWAGVLKEQGITRIEGDLVLDDSFFDRQLIHPHWPKSDLGHWYAAPIAALALNDGCVHVQITPGVRPGAAARVSLIPPTRYLRVDNHTHTVSSSKEHAPRVSRRPGSDVIECEGGVYERSDPVMGWVTVDDPAVYFGTVMREVFAKENLPIVGEVRREPAIGRSTQFRARVAHRFPLLAALAVTNKQSQNFYAEQILKTLGAERGDGSWQGGCQAARTAMGELGLDPASYVLDDGCGLSRENRASPKAFTTLLAAMHQHSHGQHYRQTLAVTGVDGTLRKRLTDESYRGRVLAKTGSFTGVRAMSGYVQTRSGEWLAFSLLINDVRTSVRSIQDEFCKMLVDCTQG